MKEPEVTMEEAVLQLRASVAAARQKRAAIKAGSETLQPRGSGSVKQSLAEKL